MMRKAHLIIALGFAVQMGMVLLAHDGVAQSRGAISIWVRAVSASNAGKLVDPRLQDIRGQLSTLFRYTSYALISEAKQLVSFHQPVNMSLRGGSRLTITPLAFEKGMIQMSLKIMEGNRATFNTSLRLANQGSLLIGGPRHGEGVIIFAISASAR